MTRKRETSLLLPTVRFSGIMYTQFICSFFFCVPLFMDAVHPFYRSDVTVLVDRALNNNKNKAKKTKTSYLHLFFGRQTAYVTVFNPAVTLAATLCLDLVFFCIFVFPDNCTAVNAWRFSHAHRSCTW